ncbi:MAG: hypothetical protein GX096_03460 [Clostridiales bacterium]|nr:hypothetical protein [Clostridiales bacterium]
MSLLHQESGSLTFSDGFCLLPKMNRDEIPSQPSRMAADMISLGSHPVHGGSLSVIGMLRADKLRTITLAVHTASHPFLIPSSRQRAFIFTALCMKDPCPDTKQNVKIDCPFGHILIFTDPHTGQTCARITYHRVAGKESANGAC